MRSARLGPAVLVAPAGALAGHGLGYLLAGNGHTGPHAVDHGYLPTASSIAVALVVGALLWSAIRPRCPDPRRRGHRPRPGGAPLALLIGAQGALFVVQELVEHAAAGNAAGLLHAPALWLGLVSQVAVAAAAALLLSTAAWAGDRVVVVLLSSLQWRPPSPTWPVPADVSPATRLLLASVASRGPPLTRA